jgi:putative FmdB family regulatory protein
MPTYEYACKNCGEHLEVVQSFKDDPLTTCPSCGGDLRKVFGSIGIAFKGSGFYKTDSRPASASKASEPDSKPADSAPKSSEAKPTEAKSATA